MTKLACVMAVAWIGCGGDVGHDDMLVPVDFAGTLVICNDTLGVVNCSGVPCTSTSTCWAAGNYGYGTCAVENPFVDLGIPGSWTNTCDGPEDCSGGPCCCFEGCECGSECVGGNSSSFIMCHCDVECPKEQPRCVVGTYGTGHCEPM